MLPTDPKKRKETPIFSGVIDYFPDAIAGVASVSFAGNQQHNPGEPLHWAQHKSTDHTDCAQRHLMEFEGVDTDGMLHCDKLAWRALAISQMVHKARAAGMSYKEYIAYIKENAAEKAELLGTPVTPFKAGDEVIYIGPHYSAVRRDRKGTVIVSDSDMSKVDFSDTQSYWCYNKNLQRVTAD